MEKQITLIVVDFQNDFCLRGASLEVPGADKALWSIDSALISSEISQVIFTVDWHPADHCSFKENGGEWPMHCLQYSDGAGIHGLLLKDCIYHNIPYNIIPKGTLCTSEEYGIRILPANEKCSKHTLLSASESIEIDPDTQVVLCGLAGDYCVLSCLQNLAPIHPMVYLDGIASIDGGKKLNAYIKLNDISVWTL